MGSRPWLPLLAKKISKKDKKRFERSSKHKALVQKRRRRDGRLAVPGTQTLLGATELLMFTTTYIHVIVCVYIYIYSCTYMSTNMSCCSSMRVWTTICRRYGLRTTPCGFYSTCQWLFSDMLHAAAETCTGLRTGQGFSSTLFLVGFRNALVQANINL